MSGVVLPTATSLGATWPISAADHPVHTYTLFQHIGQLLSLKELVLGHLIGRHQFIIPWSIRNGRYDIERDAGVFAEPVKVPRSVRVCKDNIHGDIGVFAEVFKVPWLSGFATITSQVMLGCSLSQSKTHGLSRLVATISQVMLGFPLRYSKFHSLSGHPKWC